MEIKDMTTKIKPTWCPGCPNFMILAGVKNAIVNSKKAREDFALVTGIGCHAKMYDYLKLNGINSLHGRVLPTCLGIKKAKPELTVLGVSGDGDAYAEGMEHLIHAARYDIDYNYIVHNNQVFALTVGQPTPVSELGYVDKTTPRGVSVYPINPLKIMLAAGATFVARVYSDVKQVEWVLGEAMRHKGFSFIEILQPCLVFHPQTATYKDKCYSLEKEGHKKTSFRDAWNKADEFDYNVAEKIPTGIFYQVERV